MLVRCYWNLRLGCWSIQDARTRRLIGHASKVLLRDVNFVVSEAGRQRVLREKSKNVHAYAVGTLEAALRLDAVRDNHPADYLLWESAKRANDAYASVARKRLGVFAKYNPYAGPGFRSVDVCKGTDLGPISSAPMAYLYSPDCKAVVLTFDPCDMTAEESARATQ